MKGLDPKLVLAYIDDIIIHSRTMQEHLTTLRQVLQAHRVAGLKVAPAKSFQFRSEVVYLGHQVSEGGIEMVPEYADLLVNWPQLGTTHF